jgi:hemolysin type calcium-binding protein
MSLPILAGPRRQTRRALVAAAIAAMALPSAAQAGTVSFSPDGRDMFYVAHSEPNDVTLSTNDSEIIIRDPAGVDGDPNLCSFFTPGEAVCSSPRGSVTVLTQAGNDQVEYRLPHAGFVDLGEGDDVLVAGTRLPTGRAIEPVTYFDLAGNDRISYATADRGISVTPEDGQANDGRPGDREQVQPVFETIIGSNFADAPLFGTPGPDIMLGLGGNDQITGGSGFDVLSGGPGDDRLNGLDGNDLLLMGASADGADTIRGGGGFDTIDYGDRTRPINATMNFNGADDGEAGEGDELIGSNEQIVGGKAGDTIRAPDGSTAAHSLFGLGGADTLEGADGPDTLDGGGGIDTLLAEDGNDSLFADDGERDTVKCSVGSDTATIDTVDDATNCENRTVGTLRLAPTTLRARAGKPARVRLSWRHPDGWKQLRIVELRLVRDRAPVGEISIRPSAKRVSADGAVRLVRKHTRLTRNGKTVTARLAVRLDKSLAGRTMRVEVEATDRRGARQVERDAATVRVAR